jgi:hypothetical protein
MSNEVTRQRSTDERYDDYVKNCKKQPRSFGDWLVVTSKLKHHREIIRPMIIWWQK